jgi:hypothetical protein
MRIDASGNLGLGVTPSAWDSSYKAATVNNVTIASQDQTGGAEFSKNSYVASGGTNTYIANGFATKYEQTAGTHKFFTAASGTAGNTITFTQAMTLDTSTFAGYSSLLLNNPTTGSIVSLRVNGTETGRMQAYSGAFALSAQGASTVLSFETNGSERARLTSGGDLLVGTTTSRGRVTTSGSGNQDIYFTHSDNSPGRTVTLRLGNNDGTYYAASPYIQAIQGSGIDTYSLAFGTSNSSTTATERARITATGNVVAGGSVALATTATDGFLYVPTCAGTPTGVPTSITGMAPIVVNTTNNKLYFYSGGSWRDAGP